MNKKILILGLVVIALLSICGIIAFIFIYSNRSFYNHTDKILKGEVMEMHGQSMLPTLESGDNFTITKDFQSIQRGDIIVYKDKTTEDQFVKRAIGIPGDDIELKDSKVYVNEEPLDEPYLEENVKTEIGSTGTTFSLNENEYFVLGDNRTNSSDSRHNLVGLIKRNQIIGVFVEKIE